ncbi:RNA polymerase subunit sigma-70 [Tenacibaculum discolor]|uniref:RNA polymerase sigma factor n=1 Tax=Tenacibaculum discolor TaxID=361581 RepID=A0A2G1BU86_9FLAO|nr:RNA polymerase sigma factor [Tenacibaculum discolor]MDP2541972.1 RNA polymerase sigma factor [Tenacibaculum discolor]PHN97613.1 RNA polymerase subunit sigma-70 [Tenacibaculum discolor]PHO00097.1 RNA polymerase subunit sigma-70 [Rhodobacteraceae bacterium 4F10]
MKSTKQLHQSVIDACKNNDAKAQMQLYDLYCDAMYTVALRYVKDSFIAEDVMQEAFIKAFKNIDSYKEGVAFGAWLKRIVINQSIDYLKKKKLELVSINEEITTVADDDNWNVASTISYQDIVNCIQQLKEKYRVVLTLFLLEGYDHGEISQILGISEVSSRTHLLRGKRQVQEQLKAVHHV